MNAGIIAAYAIRRHMRQSKSSSNRSARLLGSAWIIHGLHERLTTHQSMNMKRDYEYTIDAMIAEMRSISENHTSQLHQVLEIRCFARQRSSQRCSPRIYH